MIDFECPECGKQMEIESRMASERIRCVAQGAERGDVCIPALLWFAVRTWPLTHLESASQLEKSQ